MERRVDRSFTSLLASPSARVTKEVRFLASPSARVTEEVRFLASPSARVTKGASFLASPSARGGEGPSFGRKKLREREKDRLEGVTNRSSSAKRGSERGTSFKGATCIPEELR